MDPVPAAPASLMSTDGQIEALFDPKDALFHQDGYLYDPSGYSWPRPRPVQACGAPFTAVEGCECGRRPVRQHCDVRGCGEEYCRGKIRTRRARKIGLRLNAGRTDGRAVIYTVLTVPPARRQAAADPKTWKKWIARIVGWMKKTLGLGYAVERTDPCGDDGERWHPHVNLLWVRKDGFRSGYLQPDQLQALKDRWAWIVYGKQEKDSTPRPINVWTQFSTDEAKIGHWCSYLGRTWSQWEEEFPYHLRIKWLGSAPKTPPKILLEICCRKCGMEILRMQCGSSQAAIEAKDWSYQRLRDEIDWQQLDRLRKFGKWKEEDHA
jgi:hypothetical protein